VAAFSYYPSKNLGAYGDGGGIVTNDATLAEKARMLRHGGQRSTYDHELLGANSRLDEIQAAILRVKLRHLDDWNSRRRSLAARYDAGLRPHADLVLPGVPDEVEPVYHLYVVRSPLREALHEYLDGAEVTTGVHYPTGVHRQKAYTSLGYKAGSCTQAEKAVSEVLSLPLFPQLSDYEVEQVIRLIRFFFAMR
jgi:dTDP-4-amino-4,6-dideoxygalactose transaminase